MSRLIKVFGLIIISTTLLVPSVVVLAPTVARQAISQIKTLVTPRETRLVFVGDLMFDRGVLSSVNKNFSGDFNRLFDNVSFIGEADVAFGNLEGPASDVGYNVGSIYSFRMRPESLEAAQAAGFDVVSVANNHSGDWTVAAFADTVARLKNLKLLYPGGGNNYEEATTVQVKKVNGLTIGFLGFSDVGPTWLSATSISPGILLASDPRYEDIIKAAASQVDILAVSIHFGEEYKLSSNTRQQYLARLAIDSGAKIVAGHHPHVIQELERYQGGVIAYSLGNFIFDQNFSRETMEGGVLEVTIEDKDITSVQLKKVLLNNHYQPVPAW